MGFASGSRLDTIVATINSVSDVTGTEAVLSASETGIRLHSREIGEDEFVAIRVLDDGGIAGPPAGVYHLDPDDFGSATGQPVSFADAASVVIGEDGRDLQLNFEGQVFVASSRDTLRFEAPDYIANVRVGGLGRTLGTKHAMTMRAVAQGPIRATPYPIRPGVDYSASFLASGVTGAEIEGATFGPGESRDISFNLLASAQPGGLLLGFRGPALDLSGPSASFQIEIEGRGGVREFTFASGTLLTDVAASINSFVQDTGVLAVVSGTGVIVRSAGYEPRDYVGIRLNDDGGQSGFYQYLSEDDFHAAAGYEWPFSSLHHFGAFDSGRDVRFEWNGQGMTGHGLNLQFRGPDYTVQLTLDPEQQRQGLIHAATITASKAAQSRGKG